MFLPILDYCDVVFHGCGKRNEEGLECRQRWVRSLEHCSFVQRTDGYMSQLGHSCKKKRNHIVNLVEKCFNGMAASFSPNIFNLKDIIYLKTTHNMSTVTFYKLNTYIFCWLIVYTHFLILIKLYYYCCCCCY